MKGDMVEGDRVKRVKKKFAKRVIIFYVMVVVVVVVFDETLIGSKRWQATNGWLRRRVSMKAYRGRIVTGLHSTLASSSSLSVI